MNTKTLIAAALLHPAQVATLVKTAVNALIVLGSISGFFGNLYNDLTAFAVAMARITSREIVPTSQIFPHFLPSHRRSHHHCSLLSCAFLAM